VAGGQGRAGRRTPARGFFDDHRRFMETSETASDLRRLNCRHRVMIERQAALLQGARVFDIASHDGRWSFAALKSGAAHVTGVEFRADLVDAAHATFAQYGIAPDRHRFIIGDVFDVLGDPERHEVGPVDVVMCLGFLYHTLRFPDLMLGIRRLQPEVVILDTSVVPGKGRTVRLHAEDTRKQSAAAATEGNFDGVMLTGRPTAQALQFMLTAYGLEITEKIDWHAEGPPNPHRNGVGEYADNKRVTWIVRPRRG
jgi:hypothetical protein